MQGICHHKVVVGVLETMAELPWEHTCLSRDLQWTG